MRDLLGIKAKVNATKLLRICCGTWWECYMGRKHSKILKGMNVDWPAVYCGCKQESHQQKQGKPIPLEIALKHDAQNLLKLQVGCLLNGWTKRDTIVELEPKEIIKKKYHRVQCDCRVLNKEPLTLEHFLACDLHAGTRARFTVINNREPWQVRTAATAPLEDPNNNVDTASAELKALCNTITTECYNPVQEPMPQPTEDEQ